ncbi:SHOCT domain-containing protein [Pseudarthrobacter sp. MDT3-26]|uniref:SHOCT domain-containing protein n=1 Tax=Pseudarthrobacter raffinosi TaxID=2953651 RepID=UPI00208FDD37|nr:SHOCT domain-containing protein [Pseudarthrobacter sp. MDT3-26]MCO4265208.1 SHOCT domain-containing protein [Pseudarthrobacter sp. MDT3-26]
MMGHGDGMMDGWNGNSMMGGWSLTWSILALMLVLAAVASVALLVAWLVRRAPAAQGGVARGGQEAGEILRRRFAAGDIDDEEFRRRLTVLDGL